MLNRSSYHDVNRSSQVMSHYDVDYHIVICDAVPNDVAFKDDNMGARKNFVM